jgi:VIT1/CCC1 family predicted Fe2+/Mn2+ transporter
MPTEEFTPRKVEIHHDHRNVSGGWLRPMVFGGMDGLVSNAALMAGVAGGGADRPAIILTGLAGVAAGAFSMAVGEYVSVKSQAESALAEIEAERIELRDRPEAELQELIESYVARGVQRSLATEFATAISADPEQALAIHTRDEIGIDPYTLPSAWVASFASFASFALGALVPLLPYLAASAGSTSGPVSTLALSQIFAVIALFICGAAVSRVTTRSWWYSGLRQALIGIAAGVITFYLGHLVGAGLR